MPLTPSSAEKYSFPLNSQKLSGLEVYCLTKGTMKNGLLFLFDLP